MVATSLLLITRLPRRLARALAALLLPLLAGQGAGQGDTQALLALRKSYLEQWQALEADGVPGVERFASLVQRIVDTRIHDGGDEWLQLVADDLVDLFVGEQYELEKQLVMVGPSVLGVLAIDENEGDLEGFRPPFDRGEGRLRHFALNFAASLRAPDSVVDLLARLRGRDVAGTGPDSVADLATNEAGREFADWLRSLPESRVRDGATVEEWLLDRFAERR